MARSKKQQEHELTLKRLVKVCTYAEKVAHDISSAEIDANLRLAILITSFFSSIRNANSIIALVSSGVTAGVNNIHRTMIEEQINAKFILDDKSGIMAKAFYLDGERSLARSIKDLIDQGVTSRMGKPDQDWATKLKETEQRIADVKSGEPTLTIRWPSKKHRALSSGLGDIYFMTEWVFSQEIHGTPYSIDKFLNEKSGRVAFDAKLINESRYDSVTLDGTADLLLSFISLCTEEIGIPDKNDVSKFMEALG